MVRCGTLCAVNKTGKQRAVLLAGARPAGAQLLGKRFDQQGMVVPLLDEIDGKRRFGSEQYLFVESNAGARIVRRQADRDRLSRRCQHAICRSVSAMKGCQLRMPT